MTNNLFSRVAIYLSGSWWWKIYLSIAWQLKGQASLIIIIVGHIDINKNALTLVLLREVGRGGGRVPSPPLQKSHLLKKKAPLDWTHYRKKISKNDEKNVKKKTIIRLTRTRASPILWLALRRSKPQEPLNLLNISMKRGGGLVKPLQDMTIKTIYFIFPVEKKKKL